MFLFPRSRGRRGSRGEIHLSDTAYERRPATRRVLLPYPFPDSKNVSIYRLGWSGGAMVLGNIPVPGRHTFWMIVGQGPIALAVGAGGG